MTILQLRVLHLARPIALSEHDFVQHLPDH